MLLIPLLVAVVVSGTLGVLLSFMPMPKYALDTDTTSVQKVHTKKDTPRIGGLVVLSALLVGAVFLEVLRWPVIIASLAMLIGTLEDLTKKIGPLFRLLFSFAVGALACWILGIGFYYSGWEALDEHLLSIPVISFSLGVFMLGGVMHAINIMDGYNGLMLGITLIISAFLLAVGLEYQTEPLTVLTLLPAFLCLGIASLLVFNYPSGRIFSGDGGAYLIGFVLAVCSALLVSRHTEVSPWFPVTLMFYPIWETLFSIFRRLFIQKTSPGHPDTLHLHSLIHRVLQKHVRASLADKCRNFIAPICWGISLSVGIPAYIFRQDTLPLFITAIVFICVYQTAYILLNRALKK